MAMKLYSFAGDFRAMKAQIAAQYNGVALERPAFDLKADGKSKAFLAKSPMGKVPLLETADGCIFESNAIARYIARLRRDTDLCGRSFFDSGSVDSWIDFCANEVEVAATMWVYPVLGLMDFNPAVTAQSKKDLKRALKVMEDHLLYRTYLVGEAITLADIVLACALFYPMRLVLDPETRSAFPSVVRWFMTATAQPQFAAVMGPEVPLCETEVLAAGNKGGKAKGKKEGKAKGGAGGGEGKKGKKKGGDAPKAEAKEEAPAPAPKPAKKKGPFDDLPKSSMILDVWKKWYSNSRGNYYASMDKFWAELLDKTPGAWTIWFQTYNYNEDNTVDYATSNLVTGFLQRSDELRKFAFGAMQILGDAAPYKIEGCWLLRGDSIQPMLDSNPDAEYYTWTKADIESEADRKRVADLWCAVDDIGGVPLYDGKVFK